MYPSGRKLRAVVCVGAPPEGYVSLNPQGVTESAAAPTAGRASKCSIAYHEIPLLSLASLHHKRPECARELGLIHDRGDGLSGAPRPPGVLGGLGGLEGALSRLGRLGGLGRLYR